MSDILIFNKARASLHYVGPAMMAQFLNHRRMSKCWASMNGFFWIPCPVCNKEFGGHEWDGTCVDAGKGVCPWCAYFVHPMSVAKSIEKSGLSIGVLGLVPTHNISTEEAKRELGLARSEQDRSGREP